MDQPAQRLQHVIEAVIRNFPFDHYGLGHVDVALHDYPDDQEWVPALARTVLNVLSKEPAGQVEQGDRR
ncbi:hypothetical protein ACFWPV_09745 [Streptomyces uncialis]|uniref:hypothetical protein n=1 Tax=Streptomyces uncialis TaxID=1048205 RepID=UPI003654A33D